MQVIKSKINNLELIIRKLIHRKDQLVSENKVLLEENINLKKEIQEKFTDAGMAKIYKDIDITSAASNQDKIQNIREELDNYISEVDECIKILESQ